jgi:hypothetical protein
MIHWGWGMWGWGEFYWGESEGFVDALAPVASQTYNDGLTVTPPGGYLDPTYPISAATYIEPTGISVGVYQDGIPTTPSNVYTEPVD